jgi:prepilin-type N-terminal cleavage/methylation domain-containing protein
MKKQFAERLGFTLVEIVVVMALFAITSVVSTQIFISILRAQLKSEVSKEVKQNGDYAFSAMEQMIRNSTNVLTACTPPAPISTTLQVVNPDGGDTTFDCSSNQLASSSALTGTQYLTSNTVIVSGCTFTVVCPAAPAPKYVLASFNVSKGNGNSPLDTSVETYQSTISLRNSSN